MADKPARLALLEANLARCLDADLRADFPHVGQQTQVLILLAQIARNLAALDHTIHP